ncbi:hypothetical protein JOS77_17685 [Chromobacterium haemolyticum]|nr:hypothetical protein JOS77_17685 [Chromobacterium haemolyticum]
MTRARAQQRGQLLHLFQLIADHAAQRDAGPAGNHVGDHALVHALEGQWLMLLQFAQRLALGLQRAELLALGRLGLGPLLFEFVDFRHQLLLFVPGGVQFLQVRL